VSVYYVTDLCARLVYGSLPLVFLVTRRRPPRSPPFPYTTLFRSAVRRRSPRTKTACPARGPVSLCRRAIGATSRSAAVTVARRRSEEPRLNSSHQIISYAVFCLKKKKFKNTENQRRVDESYTTAS